MVRLKDIPAVLYLMLFAFQFQCGAIKRDFNVTEIVPGTAFQFQCGAIKRLFLGTQNNEETFFQFQCGAIKSSTIQVA